MQLTLLAATNYKCKIFISRQWEAVLVQKQKVSYGTNHHKRERMAWWVKFNIVPGRGCILKKKRLCDYSEKQINREEELGSGLSTWHFQSTLGLTQSCLLAWVSLDWWRRRAIAVIVITAFREVWWQNLTTSTTYYLYLPLCNLLIHLQARGWDILYLHPIRTFLCHEARNSHHHQ